MPDSRLKLHGLLGKCGGHVVFLGFAPASLLHRTSFADVLNDETGAGYQRPINNRHSLEFRRYIQQVGATTIPLTLNLRAGRGKTWALLKGKDQTATLLIDPNARVFAQVDCQHRLGHLHDVDVNLAFMSFIGLNVDDEREIFTTINGKARGLSGSLIDANQAKLAADLAAENPALYIAVRLADDEDSPWHGQLRKGGHVTTGLRKPVSLRMMRGAVSDFLRLQKSIACRMSPDQDAEILKSFWAAISTVFPQEWADPKHHLISKGVGVYSLSALASDIVADLFSANRPATQAAFAGALSDGLRDLDWSREGPMNQFNGAKGVTQALAFLRARMKPANNKEERGHGRQKSSTHRARV